MKIKISAKAPLVIVIVPGISSERQSDDNLLAQARIPFLRSLIKDYPSSAFSIRKKGSAKELWSDLLLNFTPLTQSFSTGIVCDSSTAAAARCFFYGKNKEPDWHYHPLSAPDLPAIIGNLEIMSKDLIKMFRSGDYELIVCLWGGIDRSAQYLPVAQMIEVLGSFDASLRSITKALVSRGGTMIFTSPYGRSQTLLVPGIDEPDRSISGTSIPLLMAGRNLMGKDPGWGGVGGGDLSLLPVIGDSKEIYAVISKFLDRLD